jgi:mannose-6-phosphate isomerase-like protein (cupin superfamily)
MSLDNLVKTINNKKINLTEEMILERFLDRMRWPKEYHDGQPSLECIKEKGIKHQDFFKQDGYLDSEKCIKTYEEGYTLILSNCGGLTRDIWIIQQLINSYCKSFRNCNLYLGSGRKSVSFPKHTHDYAVLVKNIYGESEWLIGGEKRTLKNQDCLFFDKNTEHEVINIESSKLSLTCDLGNIIG